MRDPQPHLENMRSMVVATLGDLLAPGVEFYSDLFAENAVLEVPFDDALRLDGKAAIDAHVRSIEGKVMLGKMEVTGSYPGGQGHMVVEYHGPVDDLRRSVRFHQTYISVFRLSAGRVTLWREYLNPLVLPKNSGEDKA